MRTIDETNEGVRLACEACGAHQTLEHPDHAALLKRGRRVECDVCGAWDEVPAQPAAAAA